MKKFISFVLVTILAVNCILSVSASNSVCDEEGLEDSNDISSIFSAINNNKMDDLSFAKLKTASQYAEDDKQPHLFTMNY